jgi:hypothetical protein
MVRFLSGRVSSIRVAHHSPQAFELYPTGCCHSSSYNKRADRLHYFLGPLPLRCLVGSTSSSTGMDIDHNGTYSTVSLIIYSQVVEILTS